PSPSPSATGTIYHAEGSATACPEGQIWLTDEKGDKLKSVCNISPKGAPYAPLKGFRHVDANGIPNHCVNKSYHSATTAQDYHFTVPVNPTPAATTTQSHGMPNAILENTTALRCHPQWCTVRTEDVAIWRETGPTCGG